MTAPIASGWSKSPGGACTHWKAPPLHGARRSRPFAAATAKGFRPKAGISPALFDHLVGAHQHRLRHGEAERRGGLEIDHQIELGRLLDRQVSRLGALEDLS